jgi:dihydroxyacetone kinase phosphotransfer subunit
MVGLVLVSHSAALAQGLADLLDALAGGVPIVPAGGGPDGDLGTDGERIERAIDQALEGGDGAVVLVDIGSAILSVLAALGERDDDRVRLVDAPFVEGAVAAAVMASTGADLDAVVAAAEEARGAAKL